MDQTDLDEALPGPLDGQRLLVVGGSGGIGSAIAASAHRKGAEVVLAARSFKRLIKAAEKVGPGTTLHQMDILDEAMVSDVLHEIGRVDHVAVAAGQAVAGTLLEVDEGDILASVQSKLLGPIRVLKAVQIRPGGSVTLVSGALARRPLPGRAVISAINAAVEALTRGLALDFAPTRVNCLSPGLTRTGAYDPLPVLERQAMFEQAAESLPTGCIVEPHHIGDLAAQIMATPSMTGAVVDVDGGFRLV